MTAPVEPPHVQVARATLDAVAAADAAQRAITAAMVLANNLGVVVPGWQELQQASATLAVIIHPESRTRALAENEVRAHRPTRSA